VSVPAEVRRRLGLATGSVLEWDQDGGQIVVRRAGRYTSVDIHRMLFPEGPPKPRTVEALKDGNPALHSKETCAPLIRTSWCAFWPATIPGRFAWRNAFVAAGAWVSLLALAETMWVLTAVYERDAAEIGASVEQLLNHKDLISPGPRSGGSSARDLPLATGAWLH